MKNATTCEMCGKNLPAFSKGYLCSPACRKAKSRLKQDAGKHMIEARNHIRAVIKGLKLDMVDAMDNYDDYNHLVHVLNELMDANNARFERQMKASNQNGTSGY